MRHELDGRMRLFGNVLSALCVLALAVWCALIFNPLTHDLAALGFRTGREYTFTEMATAAAFLGAFVLGLGLGIGHARCGGAWLQAAAFLVFAGVAAFACLEEVQYFQPLLGYDIPEWMLDANAQQEFTFHNIGELHGRPEYFYLVFCVAAYALHLPRVRVLPRAIWADVRAHPFLLPILHCVLAMTILKIADRLFDLAPMIERGVRWTTEITELYIALWALLYVAFKLWERVSPHPRASGGTSP
ncbi:hypothetical protein [Jannaschia rubra]|uniref:Uncharacterized protein n=1 Tax=Jannaschia rubra TaxID=282197 RepID=A0A0M6XS26_9RHOB|nr:hypothetical protein [Jannaschia rubra]CTQ33437.1 hypothetical protein JAN5088_02219 [Jannaschia rubra]SFG01828.1 hypothetical protein SAMN04488517_102266 [Jannaschia rubra]